MNKQNLKAMLKESIGYPLFSFSPLETKGREEQVGLKVLLKGDFLYCPLVPYTQREGWTSMIKERV